MVTRNLRNTSAANSSTSRTIAHAYASIAGTQTSVRLKLFLASFMPDLNAPMKVALLFLCHLTLCLRVGAYPTQTQDDDIPPEAPRPFDEALDNGTYGYFAVDNYVTAPDIPSPKTNWLQWSPECNDGLYYFITPRGWGIERPGPMILDWKGDLVWTEHFGNEFGGQAYDLMVQRYQGQDFLTFWTGDDRVRGHGAGSYVMVSAA